jgi:hypothetical protein
VGIYFLEDILDLLFCHDLVRDENAHKSALDTLHRIHIHKSYHFYSLWEGWRFYRITGNMVAHEGLAHPALGIVDEIYRRVEDEMFPTDETLRCHVSPSDDCLIQSYHQLGSCPKLPRDLAIARVIFSRVGFGWKATAAMNDEIKVLL